MIIARLNTCALSGTTAFIADPSRTCRWKSSGFVIVSVDAAAVIISTVCWDANLHQDTGMHGRSFWREGRSCKGQKAPKLTSLLGMRG